MKAYSFDLRQRVPSAALGGDPTIPEVAELLGVSTTFLNKLLRLHRAGADLAPSPHGGVHPPRLGARHHKLLPAPVAFWGSGGRNFFETSPRPAPYSVSLY
jgi:transposase